MSRRKNASSGTLRSLLKTVHSDEEGAVSIETVLIICAIALPILLFLYKVVWPKIQDWLNPQLDELMEGSAVD